MIEKCSETWVCRYSEIANSDRNVENIKLHKAVNDLRQLDRLY